MLIKYLIIFVIIATLIVFGIIRFHKQETTGCHFKAHLIGFAAVKKDPANWEELLSKYSFSECTGGYLMGILEGHKYFDTSFKLDEQTSVKICAKIAKKSSDQKSEMTCMHTMGHLFLAEEQGKIEKALNICSKLDSLYRYECFAGVFMENIYRRNLRAHQIAEELVWTEENIAKQKNLCNTYSGDMAKACWREISHMFVHQSKNNPSAVYKACYSAPNREFSEECYIHAVGIMTLSANFKEKNKKTLCDPYKKYKSLLMRCESVVKNNQLK